MHKSNFYLTFALLWTFAEAVLNLSGFKEWEPWMLRAIFFTVFILSLVAHFQNIRKKRQPSTGRLLLKDCNRAISKGLSYLESENKNMNDQRMRLSPSIMETATVVGAIAIASRALGKTNNSDNEVTEWLFSRLKSRFRDRARVKYFDCNECNGKKDCNVAYFDFLSHFYYAKGSTLFSRFVDEFAFMREALKSSYFKTRHLAGWGDKSQKVFSTFETSTNLILNSIFPCLSDEELEKTLLSLCNKQTKEGTRVGSFSDLDENSSSCAPPYPIITAHRAIEALSIYKGKFIEIDDSIEEAINLGVLFLKASDGFENPVDYEEKMGIDDGELLRGTGHIAQALTKSDNFGAYLDNKINYLLDCQSPEGAFIGRSEHFKEDRYLTNNTDLTAFIVRTLSIFVAQAQANKNA